MKRKERKSLTFYRNTLWQGRARVVVVPAAAEPESRCTVCNRQIMEFTWSPPHAVGSECAWSLAAYQKQGNPWS